MVGFFRPGIRWQVFKFEKDCGQLSISGTNHKCTAPAASPPLSIDELD